MKKRPVFLTIWLALMTIGAVYSVYSYGVNGEALKMALPGAPEWLIPALLLVSIVDAVAVAMLWMWKKLGWQLVVGVFIVSTIVNLIAMGVQGLIGSIFGAIGVGVLYLAMKPVRNQFK